ncbi:hypothetical protein EYC80_009054 [Monilinia laxa]|uniref:Uncharacterized protein n=1 Tax=Monilinia laxa TaxID=61186 RepID=A0A5N6K2D8_MONLA|nr:hypothetical protein EYC80_009054 [Monilinia laxa]
MVISQDIWDQVEKNNEILHDVKVEKLVATTSWTMNTVEEAKTSIASVDLMATSSIEELAPSTTPDIVIDPFKSHTTPDEVSKSRPQYLSKQTQIPPPKIGKQQDIPTQEVQKQQVFNPMIKDNFPLAMKARSAADLPPIPPWNRPPTPHVKEKTPLFIAFTRNWPLLQQTVVSWITSGWPAEDIYVIENTGTMKSNEFGRLSLQNPFFLNHTRLHMLGVNVIVTPTLYTFAQLQNFFLWTAIEKDLKTYFWSHMDIIPITFEDKTSASNQYAGHKTIYQHAVEVLRSAQSPGPDPNASDDSRPWAMRFFAFDYLTLVNRAAFESIGGLIMAGYEMNEPRHLMTTVGNDFDGLDRAGNGFIYDVANSIDDLIVLYRKKNTVEASFTDQNRPEDLEAARKHNEEQLEMEQQAKNEDETQKTAVETQDEAVVDDKNPEAHAKEMEQATLDKKSEEIGKQEGEKATNEGHIMDYSKADSGSSERYAGNNPEMYKASEKQQELQQAKENEEKESSPVVAKDPYQSLSSITSSEAGKYRKRNLDSPTNPQSKSSEDLHNDAESTPIPKKSAISPTSTNTDSDSDAKWITDEPGSSAYFQLLKVASSMVESKYSQGGDGRNTWQHQQSGGQGEPYYRSADGFEKAIQMTITLGRAVYLEKWGTFECQLIKSGVTMDDEWKPREWN